jgi:hypothetical protein
MTLRQFTNSPLWQGEDEEIAYYIDTTKWGGSPSSPTAAIYEVTTGSKVDVTATLMPGSCTVATDQITLPTLSGLTAGSQYRLEVSWVAGGGSTVEAFGLIYGEE